MNHRPEVTGRRAGAASTEVVTVRPQPPPAFLPPKEAWVHLGVKRSKFYSYLGRSTPTFWCNSAVGRWWTFHARKR
jgi:hypothetical protein